MQALRYGLVVFDLDGVVTDTARVHALAWKQLFDGFLRARAVDGNAGFEPFSIEADYPAFVDGRPRYDGVRGFLTSRGITLPLGEPADAPGDATMCALGNQKDLLFGEVLRRRGVEVFGSTVLLVRDLAAVGVRRAVASSSKNCRAVLEIAGLSDLFEERVDGVTAAELGLRGKPHPDIFLECATRLGVPAAQTVIVEDAVAGVQAGRNGGFGLVIGIDRFGRGESLRDHGADVVVPDLAGVCAADIDQWCAKRGRR